MKQKIEAIEQTRLERLKKAPKRLNMTVLPVTRVSGMGIKTADVLMREVLSGDLRDRRTVARHAGFAVAPDESAAGGGGKV